jgi:hypothetical protein
MEPVDNVSKAMEVLRRQMTENLERLRRAGKLPSQAAPKSAASPGATTQSVRETVARKIRAIDPLAPDFDRLAANVFVESVLTAEFGDALLNDPAFRDMMREVQQAMLSHEQVREQLQSVLRALRDVSR